MTPPVVGFWFFSGGLHLKGARVGLRHAGLMGPAFAHLGRGEARSRSCYRARAERDPLGKQQHAAEREARRPPCTEFAIAAQLAPPRCQEGVVLAKLLKVVRDAVGQVHLDEKVKRELILGYANLTDRIGLYLCKVIAVNVEDRDVLGVTNVAQGDRAAVSPIAGLWHGTFADRPARVRGLVHWKCPAEPLLRLGRGVRR